MKAIVLVLNRARLDAIGAYGAEDVATPHLDRLAVEGVVFDQHFAERPTEQGARRAWELGCVSTPGGLRSPVMLADSLWRSHVRATLVGGEDGVSRRTGFAHGWETMLWIRRARLPAMNQPTLVDGVLQTAVDWLEVHGTDENWCLWVEVDALRPPWDQAEFADPELGNGPTDAGAPEESAEGAPEENDETADEDEAEDEEPSAGPAAAGDDAEVPEPNFDCRSALVDPEDEEDARRLRAWRLAYGGIMTYVDDLNGQFVALLKELKLYDETLLIVTTDVGWPLGEHGAVGDAGVGLHEELIHLPLIVRLPGGVQAGRRVQQLTQPVDLYATLSEHFGLIWSPAMGQGQSLLPLARGVSQRMREYVCSRIRRQGLEEWSIRTHSWFLAVPITPTEEDEPVRPRRLHLKPDDRWEVQNLADQHPVVAEHLELTLRRYMATTWLDPLVPAPPLRDDVLRIDR